MHAFLLIHAGASAAVFAVHVALCVGLIRNFARDRRRPTRSGASPLTPEVIVAVRNEETRLPALLESLRAQTRADSLFLFVDDRSTDGTSALLDRFRSEVGPRARVLRNRGGPDGLTGKQAALDLAFAEARGDVLLFTDGDCVHPPTWIECMLECFRDPGTGAALGRIELPEGGSFLARFQAFEQPLINQYNFGAAGIGLPLGCFGNNMAARRQAVEETGGFRALGYSVTEDALLLSAIRRRGRWKVRVSTLSGCAALTAPKSSWPDYLDQHTRWNAGGLFSRDWITRLSYTLVVLVYLTASLLFLPLGILDSRITLVSLTPFASIGLLGALGGLYQGKRRLRYFTRFLPYLVFFAFFYAFVTLRALARRPFEWKGAAFR